MMSAHEHAFDHFGGVCAERLDDRMRTAIAGTTAKGKVESGVKYVKRNFLPGSVRRNRRA